jgi:allantoinase
LGTKGAIAPGRDADLVLLDPDAESVVDPERLHHRHPITPYAGMRLRGRIQTTLLRGEVIFDGTQVTKRPLGRQILGRNPGARIANES